MSRKTNYFCDMDSLFPDMQVTQRPAALRRRAQTRAPEVGGVNSRADRLARRNKLLAARFYYWSEVQRRRFDDVLSILSNCEFFVEYRTISNALVEYSDYLDGLIKDKPSATSLEREYPGFRWR